jgi:hypothetical protein
MNFVDVLIYLDPALSLEDRDEVLRVISLREGVISASFNVPAHSHAMTVQYDASTIRFNQVLAVAKLLDPTADLSPVVNRRLRSKTRSLQEASAPASIY